MNPKPYLREVSLKRDKIADPNRYPFSMPAVRELGPASPPCWKASHSELHQCLRTVRSFRRLHDGFFLRAESFFNVATDIERLDREGGGGDPIIGAYGGLSLHEQSHGESFLALLAHRVRGHGLYILDEPEAALSPKRQMSALKRIHGLVERESQFILATHSPILMAYPRAKILVLDQHGYAETPYECTERYTVARRFLSDPAAEVRELLHAEGERSTTQGRD